MGIIQKNYQDLRKQIPAHVTLVLATKKRTAQNLIEALDAGATDFGDNYVQEAIQKHQELGELANKATWHFIGHLQKNKINKILPVCNTIQTIDSYEKAEAINARTQKQINICLEINSASEDAKSGFLPDPTVIIPTLEKMALLPNIKVSGLMTMGPWTSNPEDCRPYFKKTKELFDQINKENIPNIKLTQLSMGMSDSYQIAIEEGSTMVRLGTIVFGPR
jgi:PLP dependent protein